MTTTVKKPNPRCLAHRIAAHDMHRRRMSLDSIADTLRVSKRSVSRYLALPCPEPPPANVDLAEFYLDGACHAFPEYDWLSRYPSVQAECKAICEYCPVLAKCRSYGLNQGLHSSGIWGGLSLNERERLGRADSHSREVAAYDQQGAA